MYVCVGVCASLSLWLCVCLHIYIYTYVYAEMKITFLQQSELCQTTMQLSLTSLMLL